jgi:hypothetical protein
MKPFSRATLATCFLMIALLSGCTTLPKTDLNAENREKLHSIAVLEVKEPVKVGVVNMGGAAAGFGLIGAFTQVALNNSHTNTYSKRVADEKIVFAPVVIDGVVDRLNTDGYQVVKLGDDQKVTVSADGKSDDYSGIHTDADAILSMWFTSFGYLSPPESPEYVPAIVLRARVLDAKTKQDMYFKTFACGYDIKANSVHIDSDGTYRYGTFGTIEDKFDESVQGIKACEQAIVAMIGKDLARTQ